MDDVLGKDPHMPSIELSIANPLPPPGMGGQYMFSKYKQAAKQFCGTKWHHTWTR